MWVRYNPYDASNSPWLWIMGLVCLQCGQSILINACCSLDRSVSQRILKWRVTRVRVAKDTRPVNVATEVLVSRSSGKDWQCTQGPVFFLEGGAHGNFACKRIRCTGGNLDMN